MKAILIGAGAMLAQSLLFAQDKQDPSHRFAIGLLGHYHTENYRLGLSGHFKWLLPTNHASGDRFLFSAKATHTGPADGPFFTAFDNGKYDNISSVYLMVGYRVNLFDKGWRSAATAPITNNAAYLEFNAGGAYNGLHRRFGVALNPVIGYAFNQRFELNIAYQALLLGSGSPSQSYLEAGFGYRF
ncbi:hypothetical protein ACFQRK_07965 [Parapedobacter sp. GCM10030251]|uniref:hypothetical protein n=1 Tax=Parapedobacter sp. GCM10030251 TaxID=3273419 RepID=UPI00360AD1A9